MNALTEIQTIKGADGTPAFVVMPYDVYLHRFAGETSLIPDEVVSATVDGASPMKAWREHLRLTQAQVAKRLKVTQAAYAQLEGSAHPRRTTLDRVARALRIDVEQLDF